MAVAERGWGEIENLRSPGVAELVVVDTQHRGEHIATEIIAADVDGQKRLRGARRARFINAARLVDVVDVVRDVARARVREVADGKVAAGKIRHECIERA